MLCENPFPLVASQW